MIFSRVGLMLLYSIILCTGIHCVPSHLLCLALSSKEELGNVSLLTFSFTLLTVASVLTLILYFAYQFCLIGWHEKKTQLELGVVKIPSK